LSKGVYHKPLVGAIILLGCLLHQASLFAQQPVVNTTVDKRKILIGEQLHYHVFTSMPDNTYRLSWFAMPDSLEHFQVVSRNKIDSSFPNGNINFSQDIILTSFDSGVQVIPSFSINMELLHGDTSFNLLTDSIPIQVSYSPMDSVKTFHDIKSIIEVKKEWKWWWWAILAVVVFLLLFWIRFLTSFLKKRAAPQDFFNARLGPYEEAMQSISELQKQQHLQKNEVKEYHVRLNEIFKRYLSRKTRTYKMNLTSDEILLELDDYAPSKELLFAFAGCLRMGSAVKFAKYLPPQNDSEKCLDQTKDMITEINKNLNKKAESVS
jgi:hypothetical protein